MLCYSFFGVVHFRLGEILVINIYIVWRHSEGAQLYVKTALNRTGCFRLKEASIYTSHQPFQVILLSLIQIQNKSVLFEGGHPL